jgi:hypothetical protein
VHAARTRRTNKNLFMYCLRQSAVGYSLVLSGFGPSNSLQPRLPFIICQSADHTSKRILPFCKP